MSRHWRVVFRVGLGGGLLAVAIGLLVAVGEILNASAWPLREGDPLAQQLGSICLWTFVASGFVLLIPVIGHLWQLRSQADGTRRVLWILFLLTFPFVASYSYFALYLNPRVQAQAG